MYSPSLSLLLVEDDEGLAELLEATLVRAGFACSTVGTGQACLDRVKQGGVDLLLLDYSLPDMTGRALVQKLQEAGTIPAFLVMTGHGDEQVAVEVMKLGALDYLVKNAELFERLPSAVRRAANAVQTERRVASAEQSLRESEARFRTLFDDSPLGILEEDFSGVRARLLEWRAAGVDDLRAYLDSEPDAVLDLAGRVEVRMANRRASDLLGIPPAALVGRSVAGHMSAQGLEFFKAEILAFLSGATHFQGEIVITLESGEPRWFDFVLGIQSGFEESWGRLVASFIDITPRVRTEAERRKLARAVEQSPVAVVITDARGRIEYVNPRFVQSSGYTLAEVQGATPRILKSGQQDDSIYRELWQTISAGKEWQGELCNRRKDGALYWEDVTISPLLDESGRISHFLGVKEDISHRRAVAERLTEQAALLDVTRDAIVVTTLEGRVRFWNRGAERLYGWTAAEMAGVELLPKIHYDPAIDSAAISTAILNLGEWQGELRQRCKSGVEIIVLFRGVLMRDARGAGRALLLTASDITEARQLEVRLLRSQRLESLGALAGGVAHDLNNVLTPIMMAIELLRPLAVTESDRETVMLLSDSARRGAEVVRQLLIFGRGSDAPKEVMDVVVVLREILRIVRETFPRNIAVTERVPATLPPACAHPTQLYQALLNLCVNARDAMPAGGRLALEAFPVDLDEAFVRLNPGAHLGRYIVFAVTDSGTGIDPAILDRIFDPFFTTKEHGKGTGLGLSTVVGIARSHGGFVAVSSQPGVGSEFRLFLPVVGDPVRAEAGGAPVPAEEHAVRGELILLVDDEPGIRKVLERVLETKGYRVITAENGTEALELVRQHLAELRAIVLDMMMPGIDGIAVIKGVREMAPQLPIIGCSGLHTYSTQITNQGFTGVRFLRKPFPVGELLANLRQMLQAEGAASPPPA